MARKFLIGILCLLPLFLSQPSYAQSYELYVGDDVMLAPPSPPSGALFQTSWAGRHKALQVTKNGTLGAKVKIIEYFSGVAQVQCDYYWYYYVNDRQYTNHATTYYNIYCKPVKIRLNKESMSLTAGTGEYLSYSLTPSDLSIKPTISWTSDKENVAVVNSNGYVHANSAGTAVITVSTGQGTSASCEVNVTAVTPPSPPPTPPGGGDDDDGDDGNDDGNDDGGDEEEVDGEDTGPVYLEHFLKAAKKRLNGLKIKWLDYL